MRILIADDDATSRMLLQRTLEKLGYQVIAVDDGGKAMEVLHREPDIFLAVLDWMMPVMDGLEVCARSQDLGRFIYVLLLTGRADDADIEHALEVGASDYVVKPFRTGDLRARLEVGKRIASLQTRLVQSQKLESIGQLAGGIAHEINTPIQFVSDNVQFLQESFVQLTSLVRRYQMLRKANVAGVVSAKMLAVVEEAEEAADIDYLTEEIPRALEQTQEGIERVSEIVRSMKSFSHPGSDEKSPVDLNQAIESTITVSRNEWKYVAELTTDLDPELPPVPCFAGELNQVILNLVVNAAHAVEEVVRETAGKGRITIRTRRVDDSAEISVQDTGCGIPEAVRARVFDPFFTTKEVGSGTGQGLAIARSVVVDKHHGTIDFETASGRGTMFRVRLPLDEKVSGSPSKDTPAASHATPVT